MSEIIIDGVNVAGYAFYKLGVCISPINKDCKDCKNIEISKCYFKQLKRLQEENKRLRDNIELMSKFNGENFDEVIKLRQENEELKKDLDISTNVKQFYLKENNKYKQALEEIREIICEPCIPEENCFTCKSNCLNKDVINILNEVLKDER